LLPFGTEPSVFAVSDRNESLCLFLLFDVLWKLLFCVKGPAWCEGVCVLGAEGLFGCKVEKLTGKLRKLYSEDLHDLYSSPSSTGVLSGPAISQLYLSYSSVSLSCIYYTVP